MKNKDVIEMIRESCTVSAPDKFHILNYADAEQYKNSTPKISAKKNYITAAVIYAAACVAVIIVLPFIIGGNVDPDKPVPAVSGEETTDPYDDTVYDLGGADFVILASSDDYLDPKEGVLYLSFFEDSDNIISRAVAERNNRVEEKFGINIRTEVQNSVATEAVMRAQAGQNDYDVLFDCGSYLGEVALEGYLYDLRDVKTIDFTKNHWLPSAANNLTVADRQFYTTSMLTLDPIHYADFVVFNNDIVRSIDYTSPYEQIDSGEWTLDNLIEMSIAAQKDLDSDGDIDYDDRYGGFSGEDLLSQIWQIPLTVKNDDNTYTYVPYTERTVALYGQYASKITKIDYALEDEKNNYLSIGMMPEGDLRYRMFEGNRAMFISKKYLQSESSLAEHLSNNCGAVPYPSTREDGAFYTAVNKYVPMISIPAGVTDPELTGKILDYMVYESERTLYSDYFEMCKGESETSKRSEEMLRLILDSVACDWAEMYVPEESPERSKMIVSGSFASVAKRYIVKIQEEIDDVVEKLKAVYPDKICTDEEDVVFGYANKPLFMYSSGNLEDVGKKDGYVAEYLYSITTSGEIYTLSELNAVLASNVPRLLAVSFMAFNEDGGIVSDDELREALIGDKKYTVPGFAKSKAYNFDNGYEIVVYMTADEFKKLTPPEDMRVVANLTPFPKHSSAISHLLTQIDDDDDVIAYLYYDHFDDSTTTDTAADEWESFKQQVEDYYDPSVSKSCINASANGELMQFLKQKASAVREYTDGYDFLIVPELCRVQMRIDGDTLSRLDGTHYNIRNEYELVAKEAVK